MNDGQLNGLVGNLDELSQINESLINSFKKIYYHICIITEKDYSDKECIDIFINYNNRKMFLIDSIDLIDSIEDAEIRNNILEEYNKYFEIEEKIISNENIIKKSFSSLEDTIQRFRNNKISEDDFKFFEFCMKYAYNNYKLKKFNEGFTFSSDSIDNSFFSGFNVTLSIDNQRIWHLLELPSFFKNLKDAYDNNITNEISLEQFIFSDDSMNLLKKYLLNMPLNIQEQRIITEFEENYGKDNSDDIKKDLRIKIALIISKNMNFSKIYEYKFIPEIILGYDTPGKNYDPDLGINSMNKEYNYYSSSDANTPIKNSKLQIINYLDFKSEELNANDVLLYNSIKDKFDVENVSLYVDSNYNIKGILDNKTGIEFKCILSNGEYLFKSNYSPNLFLVSYDANDINNDIMVNKVSVYKSIYITLINICRELNLSFNDIKQYIDKIDSKKFDFDLKSVPDVVNNIIDKKTKHSLNVELFIALLSNITEEDYRKDFSKFNDRINKSEKEKLKNIIKIALQNNKVTDNLKNKVVGYSANGNDIPEFGIFIPLIQTLNEMYGADIYYEKNIGSVGYCIRFNDDETLSNESVVEAFPKTFMAKNISQLTGDLRINGNSFILDTIYDPDSKKIYSTLLISENDLKLKRKFVDKINYIKAKGNGPKK